MDKFYRELPIYSRVRDKIKKILREREEVREIEVGSSYLGRKICGIGVGNDKEFNLAVGGVHGGEYITTMVLIKHFEDMIECMCEDMREGLKRKGYVIIPTVNPDGVEIAIGGARTAGYMRGYVERIQDRDNRIWHANARGVDINHNFDAGYDKLKEMERREGIIRGSSTKYGGEEANSEVETRAMVEICNNNNVDKLFTYHSQGEEIYYNFLDIVPKGGKEIADKMGELCGYEVKEARGLASYGGFKDWYILKHGRCGFTIEIGKGKNPLPLSEFDKIYKKIKDMMDFTVTI